MSGRIEVVRDEIADKIDELANLCECWTNMRKRDVMPRVIRSAIVMAAQEIAAMLAKGLASSALANRAEFGPLSDDSGPIAGDGR